MGGDCVLGLGWGKEPPRLAPRVVIGAAGTNGPIKGGHLPQWVVGEGRWAWLSEANPLTHPECQWHKHSVDRIPFDVRGRLRSGKCMEGMHEP